MPSTALSVWCLSLSVVLRCPAFDVSMISASGNSEPSDHGSCLLASNKAVRRVLLDHKDASDSSLQAKPPLVAKPPLQRTNKDVLSMKARAAVDAMPLVAWRAFEALADEKREILDKGSLDDAQPQHPEEPGNVFEAVEISLPLEPPILKHDRAAGDGQGDKNIVGLRELTRGGRNCVVYGMGIAGDSSFEQQMQELGCETHAFDCTVDPAAEAVAGKSFTFHNWCIGRQDGVDLQNNTYVKGDQDKLIFKTLSDTMKELGHSYIDLLKFDIEGFEWQLFRSEILTNENPPEQLSFELHTQKSNPSYVPQGNVHDKGYVEVNRLFRSLFDLGYRVTSREVNSGDPACAEFVAIKIDRKDT